MENNNIPEIYIVENNDFLGKSLQSFFETKDFKVFLYKNAEDFLCKHRDPKPSCLVTDINLGGISGLELLALAQEKYTYLPTILITGYGDIPMAVEALQKGAFNFLEKPVDLDVLTICVGEALKKSTRDLEDITAYANAKRMFSKLTTREQQLFDIMLDGLTNKAIAHQMEITVSTVEAHRSKVMSKLQCRSLAEVLNIGKVLKRKTD